MNLTILISIVIALLVVLIFMQLYRKDHTEEIKTHIKDEMAIHLHQHQQDWRKESMANRQEVMLHQRDQQQLLGDRMKAFGDQNAQLMTMVNGQINTLSEDIKKRFHEFHQNTNKALADIRHEVNHRLEGIQKDNNEKLEKMRETVDEKLNKTLEERLGRSFKLVSDSLEKVQKGLGEMQNLATGVGDLKKVLSNVKTRGVLGELQLGNILEQILTPDQYELNVATIPHSRNHVEFAVKFPGQNIDGSPVWLPIDSKFPLDKYEQLIEAYDQGTPDQIDKAQNDLLRTVKHMAKDIRDKYISPPHTTDFGVLFLPIEGLYAEIVRHPGMMETLQRDFRILVAGPTNLAAFLNSLQMGFRSIAIEKRSSEVWKILGAVKTEFGKFGEVLSKTQKKLQEASNVIDKAGVRTRAIERQLRDVEELPNPEVDEKASSTLGL